MKQKAKQTNFSKAWIDFSSSDEYRSIENILNSKGIMYPYSDNIIKNIFSNVWRKLGIKIKWLEDEG